MNKKYLYTVTKFAPNPTWVQDGWENQPWEIHKWKILPRTCAGAYHVKAPWNAIYVMARRIGKDGSICGNCNFNLYPTPETAVIARQRELENEIEWSSSVIALAKTGLKKAIVLSRLIDEELCPKCYAELEEMQCSFCDGSGDDPDDDDELATCPDCNGDGNWSECDQCGFWGYEYGS